MSEREIEVKVRIVQLTRQDMTAAKIYSTLKREFTGLSPSTVSRLALELLQEGE